jgi:hypothetical protein
MPSMKEESKKEKKDLLCVTGFEANKWSERQYKVGRSRSVDQIEQVVKNKNK